MFGEVINVFTGSINYAGSRCNVTIVYLIFVGMARPQTSCGVKSIPESTAIQNIRYIRDVMISITASATKLSYSFVDRGGMHRRSCEENYIFIIFNTKWFIDVIHIVSAIYQCNLQYQSLISVTDKS